jgi:hypothetical protein
VIRNHAWSGVAQADVLVTLCHGGAGGLNEVPSHTAIACVPVKLVAKTKSEATALEKDYASLNSRIM